MQRKNSLLLVGFCAVLLIGAAQNLLPRDIHEWWYDFSIKTTCLFAAVWIFSLVPYEDYFQKAVSFVFLIDRSKEILDQILNGDKNDYESLYFQTAAFLALIFILLFIYGKIYAIGNNER